MNDEHIEGMVDALWEEINSAFFLIPDDPGLFKRMATTALTQYWQKNELPRDWSVEDVMDTAAEHGYWLTEAAAQDILEIAYEEMDANTGINWDVLAFHIWDYVDKAGSDENVLWGNLPDEEVDNG